MINDVKFVEFIEKNDIEIVGFETYDYNDNVTVWGDMFQFWQIEMMNKYFDAKKLEIYASYNDDDEQEYIILEFEGVDNE